MGFEDSPHPTHYSNCAAARTTAVVEQRPGIAEKVITMKAPSLELLEIASTRGAIAVYFLVIGLRGILVRKPFLVSARWLQGIYFYCIGVMILSIIQNPPDPGLAGQFTRLLILLVGVAFGCFFFRGYFACGVTDQSFTEGLFLSLKQMNIPYEKTPCAVSLPTLGVDLLVSHYCGGVGKLKTKQWGFGTTLGDIARGMNRYYETGAVTKGNLICGIMYTIFGLFVAVMTGEALFRFS